MYTLGAFAVVFDSQNRALLCHRRDMDFWNLPGGGVQSRELPTEAVVRETREETGLDVEVDRLVGIYGKSDKDDLVFVFRCRVIGGTLTISDETDACAYFDPDELPPNTLARGWQIERIRDGANMNVQPVFRRQVRQPQGTRQ